MDDYYWWMAAAVLVGACLQGIGGLGFAMFCAPIAGLFFPQLAPGPLLVLGGAVSLLSALRERRSIDWPLAGITVGGRVAGTAAAAVAVLVLSERALGALYGALILLAVGVSAAGWHVVTTRTNMALAGVVSGLMGTITSAGAPPFAVVMQRVDPPRLRSTLGCILCAGAALSLAALALVGRFGVQQLALSVKLAPWAAAGFALSGPIAARVSPQGVRRLLLTLAGVGGAAVFVRALAS